MMTHYELPDALDGRREFFEQEAAMYREAPTEVYGFRPTPRKSWWQRLVDWWRGARQAVRWR